MTDQEKREVEERRKKAALKNMYYTRYFSVRYATAAFFFVNLYWGLMLYLSNAGAVMLLPAVLAVFAALAMWEQSRMFTTEQREAKLTRYFYLSSLGINVFLAAILLLGQYRFLYPFFAASSATAILLLSILSAGILLSVLMLAKLSRIRHNADRQYKRIQHYIASIQR